MITTMMITAMIRMIIRGGMGEGAAREGAEPGTKKCVVNVNVGEVLQSCVVYDQGRDAKYDDKDDMDENNTRGDWRGCGV